MKTVIWKELREHLRWSPLGFLAMMIVIFMAWNQGDVVFDGRQLLSVYVALIGSAVALLLGLLQTLLDERPAARALLLHRGIAAGDVFAGKLIAAAIMYFLAVFLPLLLFALFIAIFCPEIRASHPGTVLPAACIALCVFTAWPMVVILVRRHARFWGSRLIPVVTAVGLVFVFYSFFMGGTGFWGPWLGMAWGLGGMGGFLLAARGTFVCVDARPAGFQGVLLGFVLILGILTSWIFLGTTAASFVAGSFVNERIIGLNNVALDDQGTPWATSEKYGYSSLGGTYEVTSLAEFRDDDPAAWDRLQPLPEDWHEAATWEFSKISQQFMVARSQMTRFMAVSHQYASGPDNAVRTWVFDSHDRKLLVYQTVFNRRRLEQIIDHPPGADDFGELCYPYYPSYNSTHLMITTRGIYLLDPDGRSVESVHEFESGSKVHGVIQEPPKPGEVTVVGAANYYVWINDRVLKVLWNPREPAANEGDSQKTPFKMQWEVSEIRLPEVCQRLSSLGIARLPGEPTEFSAIGWYDEGLRDRLQWVTFDASGTLGQEHAYATEWPTADPSDTEFLSALLPPGPVAISAAIALATTPSARQSLATYRGVWIRTAIATLFVAAIGAIVVRLLSRRRSLSKSAERRWMILGAFFGPIGCLAILAMYPRILREPCVHCQHPSRVDEPCCESCGETIGQIDPVGIEIIDRWSAA